MNHRARDEADVRRAALRRAVLGKLRPGVMVPTAATLARCLGMRSRGAAWRLMRGLLDDAGVVTRVAHRNDRRRVVVVRVAAQ